MKLESGTDTQTNTHRSMSRGSWEKDAQFNSYGAFSELTRSTSEQDKLIGGARLDRTGGEFPQRQRRGAFGHPAERLYAS